MISRVSVPTEITVGPKGKLTVIRTECLQSNANVKSHRERSPQPIGLNEHVLQVMGHKLEVEQNIFHFNLNFLERISSILAFYSTA